LNRLEADKVCDPGYHFKLCTCAAEDIDDANCWRLMRIDTAPQSDIVIGSICPPEFQFENTSIYLQNKILEDLNKHSVFDFEYAPVQGDTLEVTMDGRELSFKYENGKFIEGEVDYDFTPMEDIAEGYIDVLAKN